MPENPLLPDRELQALYRLLKSAQTLEASTGRKTNKAPAKASRAQRRGRSALLAGTVLQLTQGDLLLTPEGDSVPTQLLAHCRPDAPTSTLTLPAGLPQAAAAAATAATLKSQGSDRLVLSILGAEALDPGWNEALKWAQRDQLPLIFACADPTGPDAFRASKKPDPARMSWEAVHRAALRSGLPILSVDGEDAVAVYRVMQESVLRARTGGGPALLWAVLPKMPRAGTVPRTASAMPLARLRRFLRGRGIPLEA